jgi:hypothetical protein
LTEIEKKMVADISAMIVGQNNITQDDIDNENAKLNELKKQTKQLELQRDLIGDAVKSVNKGRIVIAQLGVNLVKGFAALPGLIKSSYGQIKSSGLFEMDKSMKNAALEMGVLVRQTNGFRDAIIKAAEYSTLDYGVGVEDLAKMQASYSDSLGRNVVFTEQSHKAMAQLAKGTILGAEGAAEMASEMETIGFATERVRDFVEESLDKTHKLGLNASKTVKNIQSGFKLINKYNFKNGTKGLAEMASTVTKMGIQMDTVSGMADKLFNIEGAIDMSAQLQVLGGEWSKLGDPFKLMYMARNDMDGLLKSVVNATKGTAKLNKETGEFDISSLNMQILRNVAEQTGVAFEDLVKSAKNAAKFANIDSQIKLSVKDDVKEFIENTATIGKNGKAEIAFSMKDGKVIKKLVSELSNQDIAQLKILAEEKANLEEMAKSNQTFDDALNNTITLFKTAMLPLIEGLNRDLMPKVKDLVERIRNEKWIDKIGEFASLVGKVVTTVGGFILDNPIKTGIMYGLLKAGEFLFDKAQWLMNGFILAKGFNAGAAGGSFLKTFQGMMSTGLAGIGKMLLKGIGATAIGGAVGFGLGNLGTEAMKSIGVNTTNNSSGDMGSLIGTIAGGVIGALVGGPMGAMVGSGLGSAGGKMIGDYMGTPMHDGVIKSPLSNNFSKGRAIIQDGRINPIDNKDDLLAMKNSGFIDKSLKGKNKNNVKYTIEPIKIEFAGTINLNTPNGRINNLDLTKDQNFISEMTRLISQQVSKNLNLGKLSPNPY